MQRKFSYMKNWFRYGWAPVLVKTGLNTQAKYIRFINTFGIWSVVAISDEYTISIQQRNCKYFLFPINSHRKFMDVLMQNNSDTKWHWNFQFAAIFRTKAYNRASISANTIFQLWSTWLIMFIVLSKGYRDLRLAMLRILLSATLLCHEFCWCERTHQI